MFIKYKNYIFGDITYSLDFSRFLRCLQINLRSKLRLEDALEISKNVTKNSYLANLIEKLKIVEKVTAQRGNVQPVLANVLFEAENNVLNLIFEVKYVCL